MWTKYLLLLEKSNFLGRCYFILTFSSIFLCWHSSSLGQSPEAVNCQGGQLVPFWYENYLPTLIVKSKFNQILALIYIDTHPWAGNYKKKEKKFGWALLERRAAGSWGGGGGGVSGGRSCPCPCWVTFYVAWPFVDHCLIIGSTSGQYITPCRKRLILLLASMQTLVNLK